MRSVFDDAEMQAYVAGQKALRIADEAHAARMTAQGLVYRAEFGQWVRPTSPTPVVGATHSTRRCAICGESAEMMASNGPACPAHYDELSG